MIIVVLLESIIADDGLFIVMVIMLLIIAFLAVFGLDSLLCLPLHCRNNENCLF